MEVNQSIQAFAESMQRKLDRNKHKECRIMNSGGTGRAWRHCEIFWLLHRLRQETEELEAAMDTADREAIMDEAADVGNFAMMIHDRADISCG